MHPRRLYKATVPHYTHNPVCLIRQLSPDGLRREVVPFWRKTLGEGALKRRDRLQQWGPWQRSRASDASTPKLQTKPHPKLSSKFFTKKNTRKVFKTPHFCPRSTVLTATIVIPFGFHLERHIHTLKGLVRLNVASLLLRPALSCSTSGRNPFAAQATPRRRKRQKVPTFTLLTPVSQPAACEHSAPRIHYP